MRDADIRVLSPEPSQCYLKDQYLRLCPSATTSQTAMSLALNKRRAVLGGADMNTYVLSNSKQKQTWLSPPYQKLLNFLIIFFLSFAILSWNLKTHRQNRYFCSLFIYLFLRYWRSHGAIYFYWFEAYWKVWFQTCIIIFIHNLVDHLLLWSSVLYPESFVCILSRYVHRLWARKKLDSPLTNKARCVFRKTNRSLPARIQGHLFTKRLKRPTTISCEISRLWDMV